MSSKPVDHYERLGLARDATPRQVARAFRRAARTAHPDAGGTAAGFAAVAEAYRVLSNPADRVEYDRELDGGAAGWDDVGWGVDVDDTAAQGGVPGDPAYDVGGRRDKPHRDDDQGGDVEGDDAADPWLLDPLVGGPRRIPDPLVPRVMPEMPSIAPSKVETALSVATCVLFSAALVLYGVGASRSEPSGALTTGDRRQDVGAGLAFSVTCLVLAIMVHATAERQSSRRHAASILTVLAVISPLAALAEFSSLEGALLAYAALEVGGLFVGIAWARTFRERRSGLPDLGALRERDRTWVLDRYHRAVEWNRVRAALLEPGCVAVVVGVVARDLTGTPVPGRRWTYDPRTGVETVSAISGDVPHGSWVVLDDEDRVVATAPARAPEAWLGALRVGVPRPS